MRFHFSEDQLLFQRTVRDFLEGECGPERVRGLWETQTGRSSELWRALAEVGLLGVRVPEAHEGMGLDEVDGVLLLEETGRAGLAEPLVATAAVAAPLLAELAVPELSERWLKRIAVGEARVAVGHPLCRFVADAHVADLLLLGRDDEIHALPPDAVAQEAEPATDPARRVQRLDWTPRPETRVASGEAGRRLLAAAFDRGALATASQQLGACERLLDMAVAYACQREQFDKPIGSFQAVKHMLADVKVKLEYARPLVYRAAYSVAHDVPRRPVHVSMACVAVSEAANRAARTALQVHGAIGYTWEQDLHIWMRRVWSLDQEWGLPRLHRGRMAEFALADGAPLGAGRTFV